MENMQAIDNFDLTNDELNNDVVTVSMLQVALRAEAKGVQAELSDIGAQANTATSEGLFELLQQVATLLLNNAKYWTHVLASSQTVNSRDAGEALFTQFSLQERNKFSVETLSNVNGVVSTQALPPTNAEEAPAYIVVTLILGTADDRPLFGEIYSGSLLRDVLQEITVMRSRYLLVFELLWTPQDAADSLTEQELATEYAEMVAIS